MGAYRICACGLVAIVLAAFLPPAGAQSALPRFEVASVKPNASDAPASSSFPLGPGDAFAPGTLFSATNQPLISYIRFAFARSQGELLRLPEWIYNERFDIKARATGQPRKDDMRLMMRSLLAERFQLRWHLERRTEPVFELRLVTGAKPGAQLTVHGRDEPCEGSAQDAVFTAIPCGSAGLVTANSPGHARIAGRGEPLARLAALLSNNAFVGVDRLVIDRTGLAGDFDFTIDFVVPPDPTDSSRRGSDDTGPSFVDALRQQLGLMLRATKAPVDVLVIDHVERPSPD